MGGRLWTEKADPKLLRTFHQPIRNVWDTFSFRRFLVPQAKTTSEPFILGQPESVSRYLATQPHLSHYDSSKHFVLIKASPEVMRDAVIKGQLSIFWQFFEQFDASRRTSRAPQRQRDQVRAQPGPRCTWRPVRLHARVMCARQESMTGNITEG